MDSQEQASVMRKRKPKRVTSQVPRPPTKCQCISKEDWYAEWNYELVTHGSWLPVNCWLCVKSGEDKAEAERLARLRHVTPCGDSSFNSMPLLEDLFAQRKMQTLVQICTAALVLNKSVVKCLKSMDHIQLTCDQQRLMRVRKS